MLKKQSFPKKPQTSARWVKLLVTTSLLTSILIPVSATGVFAGKEGVFVNDEVYFTLEDVTLSPGADGQTMLFDVGLTNGSSSSFDFNGYGIRVADTNGNTYSAALTEKAEALVTPGSSTEYAYMATVPAGLSADQLKVDVFAWDFSKQPYMTDIGMLSVAAAPVHQSSAGQLVLNLHNVDSSLPDDALFSLELTNSYKALSNGSWYLYVLATAENKGSSSFKLPSSLSFNLKDADGLSYSAAAAAGSDKTLLPHQSTPLTFQFPIGDSAAAGPFTLDLLQKAASSAATGSTGSNGGASGSSGASSSTGASSTSTEPTVVGSLAVTATTSQQGDAVAYPLLSNGLTITTEQLNLAPLSQGTQVTGIVKLSNTGTAAVNTPSLTAAYQLGGSTLSIAATDNASGSNPSYLGAGESTVYSYSAVLPAGTDPAAVQLVVWDKALTSIAVPVSATALPAGAVGGESAGAAADGVYTPAGRLSFRTASTYRLMTETGNDILVSEIEVKNVDSKVISVPAVSSLYGGYTIGGNKVEGKATYLQSSPLLNPGQSMVVYVYASIPYDTALTDGTVYVGATDSSVNPAQKSDWVQLAYPAVADEPTAATVGTEWLVNDPGRLSTGKIVESKVYDVGTQKMLAIRILQTNKAVRNGGSTVSYAGFASGSDGSVWSLQSADSSTRLGKDGQSLTTLWTVLPTGSTVDNWKLVFGPKLADSVFADPQQYAFGVTPDTGSVSGSQIYQASLFPYTISLTNGKIVFGASGNYEITFDYTQAVQAGISGAANNRSLQLVLQDNAGTSLKTWEYSLEASGTATTLSSGANNKLTIASNAIADLNALIQGPRLAVYEKFEGGTRLVGTMSLSLY